MSRGIALAMTAEFNPWAYTSEEAHKKIAYRLSLMQDMFTECYLLAAAHDISLNYAFEMPDESKGGHNQNVSLYWKPSSQHC